MLTTAQFLQFRQQNTNQFIPADAPAPTNLVTSHIWWSDFIALSLHRLGYNVLLASPFYLLFTDDAGWANFDSLYNQFLATIKQYKVSLILGGNSTAIVPHPKTGQLLHDAAGVPVVHYWWDEPRTAPPCMHRGGTPQQYLAHLQNPHTLNVWWDIDVCEEMAAFYNVPGIHVPLGTIDGFWPDNNIPFEARRLAACFLGNCHGATTHTENRNDPLLGWANAVIDRKLANLDSPMTRCLLESQSPQPAGGWQNTNSLFVTGSPQVPLDAANTWGRAFLDWEILNLVFVHRTRNLIVKSMREKWGEYFMLIGKGWDQMGLKAAMEHSGLPAAGDYYANARASLNLFGGCVHGGMPLRPYEIAASHGLIVSHYSRELPALFEPGKECLAFKNAGELHALIDRLIKAPGECAHIIPAGRKRTLATHLWEHRLRRILEAVEEKFGELSAK